MSDPSASPPPVLRRALFFRGWRWLAAAATGLMLILSFPPWNQGWLCWFALTPLISALLSAPEGKRRWLRLAGLGYLSGWIFIAGAFWWLGTLAPLFQSSFLYCLPALLAFYMGLYVAAWSWFIGGVLASSRGQPLKLNSSFRNLLIGVAGAAAWLPLEYWRTWFLGGFGWNPLGVALHQDLAMIQIADITGVPGLSFLVAFVNLMAVIVARRLISDLGPVFLTRVRWEFSVTMAMVAAVFAYGVRTLLRKDSAPSISLRTALIQPNIPQSEKHDPAMEDSIFSQLDRLTSLAALSKPRPQLFIWPEASTPRSMFADSVNYDFVIDQAKHTEAALLLGTIDFDLDKKEDYNIAALLTDSGEKQQFYRKIHLVPFGEFLPLRPLSTAVVGELVPSDFTPGTKYTLLQLTDPPVRLAALICFEDTVGDLTRRFVLEGAQLLVNITNDGWFARSPAAEQHLANALFRCVETRRPLVRCGNTGVTCSVDTRGRVDLWMRPFEEGFSIRDVSVPITTATTFYTRNGDWFTKLCAGITLAAGLGSLGFRKPPKSP